jgi:hypothetical protein
VLLGTLLTQRAADAATACALAGKAARAALALAAGQPVDGVISSQVSRLVKGGVGSMGRDRFKAAVALLLVGGLLSTAGALAYSARSDKRGGTPPEEAPAPQDRKAGRPVAAPARRASLRYKFKEGDRFSYVVEKKTETRTTAAGSERVVVATQTWDVTWKVSGIDSDGNARVTLTVDRLRYVEDNGFPGKVEFDSRKMRNPAGVPAIVRVLSAVLKAQVGAEFTCTVSPRGEVSAFKVPRKLANAVRNTPGVRALYSAESFRRQLACQGGVVLPKDPVYKGRGWDEKTEVAVAGGHARMAGYTRATYQGQGDRGGKKLDEIALVPTATTLERSPSSGLGRFTLKGHEGKGRVLFDNDRGRLVETEVTQDLEMETGVPGQTVVWRIKLSLSTKLAPPR